jgi:hypothetical protein
MLVPLPRIVSPLVAIVASPLVAVVASPPVSLSLSLPLQLDATSLPSLWDTSLPRLVLGRDTTSFWDELFHTALFIFVSGSS